MFEQDRGNAATLMVVADRERHFGFVAATDAVVAGDGDERAVDHHDQGEPVDVVDGHETLEFSLREHAPGTEEPHIKRLRRQAGVQELQGCHVGGKDRAHLRRPTISQEDLGLEILGVARRQTRLACHAGTSTT